MYPIHVLLPVLILVPLTLSTTTGKPDKPDTKASKDRVALKVGENLAINNTQGAIITTSFDPSGNPVEQCQCTLPNLCYTKLVTTGNRCQYNYVCCQLPKLLPSTTPDSSQQSLLIDSNPTHMPQNLPTETPMKCGVRNSADVKKNSASEVHTSFGEFPWMAMILGRTVSHVGVEITENVFVCGASLLSPSIVLTAAHCVVEFDPNYLKIRVGEYNVLKTTSEPMPHQDRFVVTIIKHPDFDIRSLFNVRSFFNDIALLKVNKDFVFAPHISPICTSFTNPQFVDYGSYNPNNCLATGWGKIASNGDSQTILKKVDLSLIEQNECENRLQNTSLSQKFKIHPSSICAEGQRGFNTCEGDDGGPLVCASNNNPNIYVQVGIVSWGLECGSNLPVVYASLYAKSTWLKYEFDTLSESGLDASSFDL